MSHAQGCRMLSARMSRSRVTGLSNIMLTKTLSGSLDGFFGKPLCVLGQQLLRSQLRLHFLNQELEALRWRPEGLVD